MTFNPLQNYQQGFAMTYNRRRADLEQEKIAQQAAEQDRLRTQRQSAVDAGLKSDAFKKLLVDQPKFAFELKNHFKTDEKGLGALVEDSAMLLHQLDIDPSGQSAMQLLQNRKENIGNLLNDNGTSKSAQNTDSAIKVLQEQGVDALKANLNKFMAIPAQIQEQARAKSPFQRGGDGLVFNPNTGTFAMDPVAKAALDEKARKAVAIGTLDFKDRQSLNKDVTAILKDTISVRKSAAELDKLKGRGTAASKLGGVFKFMKSLDPTSVVRESEQGQVYAAEGAASQLAGTINSVMGQGKLTEKGFKDIVDTAKTIANANMTSTTTELNSLLDTFEDTIPTSFRDKISKRIPKPFELSVAPQTTQATQAVGQQFTSPSGIAFTVGD